MPFASEAQRKFLWAKHPEVAKKFAEHTPKNAKLPEKINKESMDMLRQHLNKEAFWKEILGKVKTRDARQLVESAKNEARSLIESSGYKLVENIDHIPKSKRTGGVIDAIKDFSNKANPLNYVTIPAMGAVIANKPNAIGRLASPLHSVFETGLEQSAMNAFGKLHEGYEALSSKLLPEAANMFVKPSGNRVLNRLGAIKIGGDDIGTIINPAAIMGASSYMYEPGIGFGRVVGRHIGLAPLTKEMELLGKMKQHEALESVVKRIEKIRSNTGEYDYIRRHLGYDPVKEGFKGDISDLLVPPSNAISLPGNMVSRVADLSPSQRAGDVLRELSDFAGSTEIPVRTVWL